MIFAILRQASRLDAILSAKIGRPYRAILSAGLVLEIVRRIREIAELPASERGYAGLIVVLIFYAALLINQLGELFHRLEHARKAIR
jgi:hypothetical protein